MVKENDGKIKEEDKKELNDKIEPLKNAVKSDTRAACAVLCVTIAMV